jgi:hypothetical protein
MRVTIQTEEEATIPDGFYLGKQMYESIWVTIKHKTYYIHSGKKSIRYDVAITVKDGKIEIKKFDNES